MPADAGFVVALSCKDEGYSDSVCVCVSDAVVASASAETERRWNEDFFDLKPSSSDLVAAIRAAAPGCDGDSADEPDASPVSDCPTGYVTAELAQVDFIQGNGISRLSRFPVQIVVTSHATAPVQITRLRGVATFLEDGKPTSTHWGVSVHEFDNPLPPGEQRTYDVEAQLSSTFGTVTDWELTIDPPIWWWAYGEGIVQHGKQLCPDGDPPD